MPRVPIGYRVRRPMTINGTFKKIGEELTQKEIKSLTRIDGVVGAGKIVPIWADPQLSAHNKNTYDVKPTTVKRKYTKRTPKAPTEA